MAVYQIVERALVEGGLYVRAVFWRDEAERRGGVPGHVDSFIWGPMRTERNEFTKNAEGHLALVAGGFLDPRTIDDDTDLSLSRFVSTTRAVTDAEQTDRLRVTLEAKARKLDFDAPRTDRSDYRPIRSRRVEDDTRGMLAATSALDGEVREVT